MFSKILRPIDCTPPCGSAYLSPAVCAFFFFLRVCSTRARQFRSPVPTQGNAHRIGSKKKKKNNFDIIKHLQPRTLHFHGKSQENKFLSLDFFFFFCCWHYVSVPWRPTEQENELHASITPHLPKIAKVYKVSNLQYQKLKWEVLRSKMFLVP